MTKNIKIVLGIVALGAVLYFVFKKPENIDPKEPARPNIDTTTTPTDAKPNA
tara:strand:- start:7933 stop:8088 length:156 start_codon:yes stop_codon:yes gene_type:complete